MEGKYEHVYKMDVYLRTFRVEYLLYYVLIIIAFQ